MQLGKNESKAPSQPDFEILGPMGVDGSMTPRLAGSDPARGGHVHARLQWRRRLKLIYSETSGLFRTSLLLHQLSIVPAIRKPGARFVNGLRFA
jgi:hypothetical protein